MSGIHRRPFGVSEAEYPFKSNGLERNGATLHYIDEGSGTPVLMLHGNPTWSFLYRGVIKELNGVCRCIAPDYPGFSDHPAGYGYTPQEHAEWVGALVDHLKLDCIILAIQDWGGPIGLSVAVDRPQRIAGLVICNTWCWAPSTGMKFFSAVMGGPLGKYLHLQKNFFAAKIVPSGIGDPRHRTPEILKAYTDPFPTPQARMGTYIFPRAIRMSSSWLESIESKLFRLKGTPVEMVWAIKDIAFAKKPIIERWQSHFPGAPMDRIEEAKHYLQEDHPERVAAGIKRVLSNI